MIWLIIAHYLGDCALQTQHQAEYKGKKWYVMLCHCMVWAGCISIALEYIGCFVLWKFFFLVIGHWLMDKWKCKRRGESNISMYIDQGFHLSQCLLVYLI